MLKPSLLLALLIVTTAHAQTAQQLQQLVQDAMQKQQAGDLEGAVTEYRQFLKLHPEAAAIHSNLGAALAGLGRFEEALPEYKIALRQSPKLEGARLNLALVYYKMGKIDDAATELEKVYSGRSSKPPGRAVVGRLLSDAWDARKMSFACSSLRSKGIQTIWPLPTCWGRH